MKIVIDAAIPWGEYYFASLGEVVALSGREIDAAAVRDADVVVVRTVTRVDRALLEGSRVRFVASATSGTDHVDTDYLAAAGIGFAAAPGCNARSVAEYVLSSLCVLAGEDDVALDGRRAGIIGCGHVGTMVVQLLEASGISCLVNDPPRARQYPREREWQSLDALRGADIISLHVPLVRDGEHPTRDLVDAAFLNDLKPGVILINTSRGEVVDEAALAAFLESGPRDAAVLDVWRGEPDINTALLSRVRLGTPHIAGYSTDAKLRGTCMVYAAARAFLGVTGGAPAMPSLPDPGAGIRLAGLEDGAEAVAAAVLGSYDVRRDSNSLVRILGLREDRRGGFFGDLRNRYPLRREFPAMRVSAEHCSGSLVRRLRALGFQIVKE